MSMLWIDTLPNATVAIETKIAVSLLQDTDINRFQRMTLTRTIIGIDVARLTHDSGEGSEQVFLGIGIVSQDAFATGGAATPDPFSMQDFPIRGWVWRAAYRVYGFAADQPAVYNARVDLDIRGQRKLENGVMVLMITNKNFEGSNSVITVNGIIRQLWKMM